LWCHLLWRCVLWCHLLWRCVLLGTSLRLVLRGCPLLRGGRGLAARLTNSLGRVGVLGPLGTVPVAQQRVIGVIGVPTGRDVLTHAAHPTAGLIRNCTSPASRPSRETITRWLPGSTDCSSAMCSAPDPQV